MIEWVIENITTIIIISVVFLVIVLDVIYLIRMKKKEKSFVEMTVPAVP